MSPEDLRKFLEVAREFDVSELELLGEAGGDSARLRVRLGPRQAALPTPEQAAEIDDGMKKWRQKLQDEGLLDDDGEPQFLPLPRLDQAKNPGAR